MNYFVQSYTCESGAIGRILIPENVTEDDLLAFKDFLEIVVRERLKRLKRHRHRQKARARMQIVIDIPDTAYRGIIKADHAGGNWSDDLLGVLCRGVANGTPLPKGHQGRGMKRTYDAEYFEGKCPYTDKLCYEWECDTCEIDAQEKKDAEELDRAESEDADDQR